MGKLAINHNPVRHCRLRCSKLQFAHVHCCAHKRFLYCDCQHLYLHVLLNSRWTCDKSLHSLFPLLRCFWLVHNSTHISNTIICCWVHPATCITVCKLQLLLRQEQSAPEARCPLQIISIDLGLVFGRCKAAAHLCKYGQRRTRQLRSRLVDGAPDFLLSQQQYSPSRPVWLEATSVRNVPVALASRQTDWWFCWGATGLQVCSGRPLRCKRLSQVGIVLEQQVALGVCAQVAHEPRQQFRNLRHPGKVHPP